MCCRRGNQAKQWSLSNRLTPQKGTLVYLALRSLLVNGKSGRGNTEPQADRPRSRPSEPTCQGKGPGVVPVGACCHQQQAPKGWAHRATVVLQHAGTAK